VDNPIKFQTKDQSIHRLQEGISFGDGADYTLKEYQKMASDWSKEWKKRYYSAQAKPCEIPTESKPLVPASSESMSGSHSPAASTGNSRVSKNKEEDSLPKMMTPENLERDYWDIVETQRLDIDVDYGNDVDTTEFGSGFPISERGRSVNSTNFLTGLPDDEIPEPEFGTEDFYRETFWNLNNIPNSKHSALRHLKVGINGINVPWL
jgi:histone demethylase JARID1